MDPGSSAGSSVGPPCHPLHGQGRELALSAGRVVLLGGGDGDIYGMEVPEVCFAGKMGERARCEGKGREEEEEEEEETQTN